MLKKVISGGQTGVDRGALDAALEAGVLCGGWCPEGRKAEDGEIPARYPVTVLPGAHYRQRTRQNVMDSDGSLIIYFGELVGGTRETVRFCERFGKAALIVDGEQITPDAAAAAAINFIERHRISVLNVAGPRESTHDGAGIYSKEVIRLILRKRFSYSFPPTRVPWHEERRKVISAVTRGGLSPDQWQLIWDNALRLRLPKKIREKIRTALLRAKVPQFPEGDPR